MIRTAWLTTAGVALLSTAGPALAQFEFTDQTRRVHARAFATSVFGPPSQMEQQFIAPGFGFFSEVADAAAFGGSGSAADGRAQQTSWLQPTSIAATGLSRIGSKRGSAGSYGTGQSNWDFIVTFTVAQPTWVHVDASVGSMQLAGSDPGSREAWLEFKRNSPSGPVLLLSAQYASFGSPPFSVSGPLLLEPGSHTVTFQAQSQMTEITSNYQQAQTVLNLSITVVPSPAAPAVLAPLLLAAWRRCRPRS